jgi:hypothetical protein
LISFSVAPSVRAPSQLLGAPLGSDVQLECQVEASPAPVSYWLKGGRMPQGGFAGVSNTIEQQGQHRPEMLLDGYVGEIVTINHNIFALTHTHKHDTHCEQTHKTYH